ncbi:MAG: transposase [Aggregatilineaceae bacterium]
MDKRYRTYTQEFKLEALELLKSSGKSAAQLERELGISGRSEILQPMGLEAPLVLV